jgi:plasmid segregation protein ParM
MTAEKISVVPGATYRPNFIGCDDGYAVIKLAYLVDGKIVQRAFPARATIGANVVTQTSGQATADSYATDGLNYHVSEHLAGEDTRFASYPTSGLNRILIHHALRSCGFGDRRVTLATGLPPGRYYQRNGLNQRLISAKQRNMRVRVAPGDSKPLADILTHDVFAEAAAGLIDYAFDERGQEVNAVDKPIAIVDIGGRTTDCLTILPPGNQVDHSRSGTTNDGVLNIYDVIEDAICGEHNLESLPLSTIEGCVRRRHIVLSGRTIDVGSIVDEAIHEVSERLLNYVQTRLQQSAEFEKILFIGGGAEILQGMTARFPQAFIPRDPSFANARGLLKFMLARHA